MATIRSTCGTGDRFVYNLKNAGALERLIFYFTLVLLLGWTALTGWLTVTSLLPGSDSSHSLLTAGAGALFCSLGVILFLVLTLSFARLELVIDDIGVTKRDWSGRQVAVPWAAIQRLVRSSSSGEGMGRSFRIEYRDPLGRMRRLELMDDTSSSSVLVKELVIQRCRFTKHWKRSQFLGLNKREAWER